MKAKATPRFGGEMVEAVLEMRHYVAWLLHKDLQESKREEENTRSCCGGAAVSPDRQTVLFRPGTGYHHDTVSCRSALAFTRPRWGV